MTRIAPKDLNDAIAAAKPGDLLELDGGEHVGQVVIDRPLVIEGRGASTWLGNRTGPVLIIRCAGVELRELQIEMTGDLQHPAILAEGNCEPTLRNVAIRRGELHVEGPLLSFAAPPPIRLRELLASAASPESALSPVVSLQPPRQDATALSMPPPPPGMLAGAKPQRAPTVPPSPSRSAAALSAASSASALSAASSASALSAASLSASPSSPAPSPEIPAAGGLLSSLSSLASLSSLLSSRRSRTYALAGLIALGLCGLLLYLVSGSTARSSASRSSDPTSSRELTGAKTSLASPAPPPQSEPPPLDELQLTSSLRTNIEMVGWSQDEESFVLEITYGRDSANPERWRVRALVDAASERVLKWQDLSAPPARVVAGEDEKPPWSKDPETLQIEELKSGSVIEPSQLDVRWCGNKRSPRFPASARPFGRELELTWGSSGEPLASTSCRAGDFGQLLLQMRGSPWRLMRFLPWKGSTSTVRIHRSPSGRRALVIALFRFAGKSVTRFYTRLLGPQIHILSSNPDLRGEALRQLGTPGLFMSEDARAPVPGPSRILVRADDEDALRIALPLQERLQERFSLAEIEKVSADRVASPVDDSYLWGDILIVLK